MEMVCNIIFFSFLGYIAYCINNSLKKENKRRLDDINRKFEEFKQLDYSFNYEISNFFSTKYSSYKETYSKLSDLHNQMIRVSEERSKMHNPCNYLKKIKEYSDLLSKFQKFEKKINQLPITRMMREVGYGEIEKNFWESVCSISKETADYFVNCYENYLQNKKFMLLFDIDYEKLCQCIWFYAMEKPYSAQDFRKAVNIFEYLNEKKHVDIIIAELYTMKKIGGEKAVHDTVNHILHCQYSPKQLTLIASALMWIKSYQMEYLVLQHMLSIGMEMTEKTQDRLHALSNCGGKAPNIFETSSNDNSIYFDVSALVWKDDEYTGLFENLAFQEKLLPYSLAIRAEDKELFIMQEISICGTKEVLSKLNIVFAEEYGNAVTAILKKCIALSDSDEETLDGILIESNECKQMGIFVYVARIGKRINIKFYTLFMPIGTKIEEQKQMVLSLYKKLSPSVSMWESSIKDTTLLAIQQLLNSLTQVGNSKRKNNTEFNKPIF